MITEWALLALWQCFSLTQILSGLEQARLLTETALDGVTVFDDDARDVLTGSAGLDWSLFNDAQDKATDLSDDEFANVLDFILAEL